MYSDKPKKGGRMFFRKRDEIERLMAEVKRLEGRLETDKQFYEDRAKNTREGYRSESKANAEMWEKLLEEKNAEIEAYKARFGKKITITVDTKEHVFVGTSESCATLNEGYVYISTYDKNGAVTRTSLPVDEKKDHVSVLTEEVLL
jgi:hypothetical protein